MSAPSIKQQLQSVAAAAKKARTDGMAASLETIAENTAN